MKRICAQKPDEYENATKCYICNHAFEKNNVNEPKVCDYDHITGFFYGAAHCQCNLERPVCFRIHIIFKNFRGYDAHLIVNKFEKRQDGKIKVICQNME